MWVWVLESLLSWTTSSWSCHVYVEFIIAANAKTFSNGCSWMHGSCASRYGQNLFYGIVNAMRVCSLRTLLKFESVSWSGASKQCTTWGSSQLQKDPNLACGQESKLAAGPCMRTLHGQLQQMGQTFFGTFAGQRSTERHFWITRMDYHILCDRSCLQKLLGRISWRLDRLLADPGSIASSFLDLGPASVYVLCRADQAMADAIHSRTVHWSS